jgi:hypothetical protein
MRGGRIAHQRIQYKPKVASSGGRIFNKSEYSRVGKMDA